ncbi:sonic hedgehog protein [Procambarus clarkii]|uniref:sonic hedgehog protein n=1 Tax=Procambarus clarkii TaxID=6728 RepID=UPI001E671499|nr:sonic hedgehog protein A-like [Procambarus clarkii]
MGHGARARCHWWGSGTPHLCWKQVYTCLIILTVLSGSFVQCCGPGRGGGRRRSPRKLRPLVFKQHVPNVSEKTLGASGLTEGPITRDDPRFQNLVPNYNSDIIFKDEEGTGADRLMTERCKEKLNTLAISVMNQWPGVKVRVTEGWDEELHHAPHSLHYEGRALDITTSDKDRSKYGMLARLAREAGFDWVYYESRSHIHCSVKSESSAASKLGGCFPGRGEVTTPTGRVPVSSIREGDEVQVMRPDGTLAFSPVLMFLHRDLLISRSFLTLTTASGAALTLTPSHLILLLQGYLSPSPTPTVAEALERGGVVLAGRVEAGDFLLVTSHGKVRLEQVVGIRHEIGEGVFAPLTAEGTVVVDGLVASCYAVIDSQAIAHWAFLPVRLYSNLKEAVLTLLRALGALTPSLPTKPVKAYNERRLFTGSNNSERWREDAHTKSVKTVHIHWYPRLLYTLASWLLPAHLVYS